MSEPTKLLFIAFVLLALGALGHDIYIWQNATDHPFAFAAIGWITKTYLPAEHQMVVDMLGAEAFNEILTPLLKIPAFFLTAGIATFIYAASALICKFKSMNSRDERGLEQKFKRYHK